MRNWLAIGLLLSACIVQADMPISTQVQRLQDNSYHLKMEFEVDASVEHLHALLTDYNNLQQLHPAITSSELLIPPNADTSRVETVTEDCFLFFCKTMKRVEDVSSPSKQRINSVIVPEMSDFSYGIAAWTLNKSADKTHVLYEAVVTPNFTPPPLIGTVALQSRLRAWLNESATRINELSTSSPLITLHE